jgi:hypothetical protein
MAIARAQEPKLVEALNKQFPKRKYEFVLSVGGSYVLGIIDSYKNLHVLVDSPDAKDKVEHIERYLIAEGFNDPAACKQSFEIDIGEIEE